jgi:hypothetical protein
VSPTANNPPPVPYIDITDLKKTWEKCKDLQYPQTVGTPSSSTPSRATTESESLKQKIYAILTKLNERATEYTKQSNNLEELWAYYSKQTYTEQTRDTTSKLLQETIEKTIDIIKERSTRDNYDKVVKYTQKDPFYTLPFNLKKSTRIVNVNNTKNKTTIEIYVIDDTYKQKMNNLIKFINDIPIYKYTPKKVESIVKYIKNNSFYEVVPFSLNKDKIDDTYKKNMQDLINLIDNHNSVTSLGTIEYLDSVAKLNTTNIACVRTSLEDFPSITIGIQEQQPL